MISNNKKRPSSSDKDRQLKQPKKEKNKSAYVVIYDDNRAIVCEKNNNASNNPGEKVFPGGTDKNDTIEQNAFAELRQELNLTPNTENTSLFNRSIMKKYGILQKDVVRSDELEYGTVYLKISSSDLDHIVTNFESTEEISKIQAMPISKLVNTFNSQGKMSTWFKEMAKNIPQPVQLESKKTPEPSQMKLNQNATAIPDKTSRPNMLWSYDQHTNTSLPRIEKKEAKPIVPYDDSDDETDKKNKGNITP